MTSRELAEWQAYYELETVGDELAWKLNGHLAATLRNTAAFSRPRRPLEADDCLWFKRPEPEEMHQAARKKGHVRRVVEKLTKIFPGLKK